MDTYAGLPTTLSSPARDGASIVPSDTTDLTIVPRALYVGQAGNIATILAGGQNVTFSAVPAGTILPVRIARVLSTGTSASALVALW